MPLIKGQYKMLFDDLLHQNIEWYVDGLVVK